MKQLSVIIPTYNEEKRISGTLKAIIDYLDRKNIAYEILVSDGNSGDKTREIVGQFCAQNQHVKLIANQASGKGLVTRNAVAASNGDLILLSDADLSIPITEFEKLASAIDSGADIAIGSKSLPGSQKLVRQPTYREMLGKMLNRIIQFFYLPGIWDTQCGFKLFKGEIAREIFSKQKINGFLFDVEVLYAAKKKGYKITEIPVV